MVSIDRVSRWVMYFGVLAIFGALGSGSQGSLIFGIIFIGQYAVLQLYRGYQTPREPAVET